MNSSPEDSPEGHGPASSPDREASGATAWITGVVCALVLYILSPGVMVYYSRSGAPEPPEWMRQALSPLEWCYNHFGPVKAAYDAYFKLLSGN